MTTLDTAALAAVTGGYTNSSLLTQQLASINTTLAAQQAQPQQSNQLALGFALGSMLNR